MRAGEKYIGRKEHIENRDLIGIPPEVLSGTGGRKFVLITTDYELPPKSTELFSFAFFAVYAFFAAESLDRLDLPEIRHLAEKPVDAGEKRQPVAADGFVLIHDQHFVEEGVDEGAKPRHGLQSFVIRRP